MVCNHMIINDKCVECGKSIIIFAIEDRPCSKCKNFKIINSIPICRKNLISVTSDMRVTYDIKKGSCYE